MKSLLRDYLKRKTKEITGKSASGNKRNLYYQRNKKQELVRRVGSKKKIHS